MASTYVNIDTYKNPDGSIDWNAYHDGKKNNGEICYRCGQTIMWHKGYRTLCSQCQSSDLKPAEELHHQVYVRCPFCGHRWAPYDVACDGGGSDPMYEGEHDVTCYECNKEFTIRTYVEHHFYSPPMKPRVDEEE